MIIKNPKANNYFPIQQKLTGFYNRDILLELSEYHPDVFIDNSRN